MSNFEQAYEKAHSFEGGYVNNPSDRGGETNFGITKKVARENGYKGDMRDLTEDKAKEIYKKAFWDKYRVYMIEDEDITTELFEEIINMGPYTPIRNLQEIYVKLSGNKISIDGIMGSETSGAINNYRYKEDILLWMNILQGKKYWNITENDESQLEFLRGWGKRVKLDRR